MTERKKRSRKQGLCVTRARSRDVSYSFEPLESRIFLDAVAGLNHTHANVPTTRQGYGSALVSAGHDVLIAGGYINDSLGTSRDTSAVDIYHVDTGLWSSAKLSAARHSMHAIAVGNLAAFVGGSSGEISSSGQPLSNVDLFDTSTDRWTFLNLPRLLGYVSAIASGTKLIAFGGYTPIAGGIATQGIADIYDTATQQWKLANLPNAGPRAGAITVGHYIVFTSDPYDTKTSKGIDVYNTATDQWTGTTLAVPSARISLVTVGQRLWLFSKESVTSFDPATLTSNTVSVPGEDFVSVPAVIGGKVIFDEDNQTSVPNPLAHSGVFNTDSLVWSPSTVPLNSTANPLVFGSKAIFAGGWTEYSFGVTDTIDIYDASTGQWTTSKLSRGRRGINAFVSGDKAVFAGGYAAVLSSEVAADLVDIYDNQTGQWTSQKLKDVLGNDLVTIDNNQIIVGNTQFDVFAPGTLDQPTNPLPERGAGLADSPTDFQWVASPGATQYDLYIDESLAATVTTNHWTSDLHLATGLHSWQVVARDATTLAAGQQWLFTIGAPAIPSVPGIPDGSEQSRNLIDFSWAPSIGATSYDLTLDGVLAGTVTAPVLRLRETVVGGTHTWQVTAKNGLASTPGPMWRFSTPLARLTRTTMPFGSVGSVLTAGPVLMNFPKMTGYNNGTYNGSAGFDLFDSRRDKWTSGTLPLQRANDSHIAFQKHIYAAGGVNLQTQAVSRRIDVFDANSRTWTTLQLPRARTSLRAAIAGKSIVFYGGFSDPAERVASLLVQVYNTATHKWSVSTLPSTLSTVTVTSVGEYALFSDEKGKVVQFNSRTEKWRSVWITAGHDSSGIATVGGLALFAGGAVSTDTTSTDIANVDIFDSRTGRWSTAKLSEARYSLTAITYKHSVFFAGGTHSVSMQRYTTTGDDMIDIFNAKTRRWSTAKLSAPRSEISAVTVGTKVIFAGGVNQEGNQFDAVDIYDTQTGGMTSEKLTRGGVIQATALNDQALFAAGNRLNVYDAKTSVWSLAEMSNFYEPVMRSVAGKAVLLGIVYTGPDSSNSAEVFTPTE